MAGMNVEDEGRVITSTCGYCSTGCNLSVTLPPGVAPNAAPAMVPGPAQKAAPKVAAAPDYPVNRGKACPKGFQFLGHLDAPGRALTPYLRDDAGVLRPVGWDEATTVFVERMKQLQQQHGPGSIATLGTGQITCEELAYLGALARFGMGVRHCDGNTRQCMATAAVAHKQSFGFDSPPFSYQDFEESDVLVFVGANPVVAHPIMWQRVKKNAREPRIIVIDPRATETAVATGVEHWGILPKSDLALFYGLANLCIERGAVDRDFVEQHTSGFDDYRRHVASYALESVALATGVDAAKIEALADLIHQGKRVSFWWTMGVNQGYQAVRTAQAIINLALLTGNIGRPGTGANSITGQCNAMGSRLFSNTASLYCGRDFAQAEHRAEVGSVLGIDEALIPREAGMAYDQIIEAAGEGKIRGLWIICTNPLHSWPDRNALVRALANVEFVVVQDIFIDTATAEFADLILPAAGCGEKDGTFINSERRIGRVSKVLDPPGEALPDLQIFQKIARAWGCEPLLRGWDSPERVFAIMKRLSKGRPCDISGIAGYSMLERSGGIQWPLAEGSELATESLAAGQVPDEDRERRLFADGRFFHPDGRARFLFEEPAGLPETPDAEYPYVLLTGRGSVYQWHTLTRTDKAPLLKKASPDPATVQISPHDAETLGVGDGDLVEVRSRRGSVKVRAVIGGWVAVGQVFMSMHYPLTNDLTLQVFDTYSRQPAFKSAAVSVKKAEA
jgi:anaerobic selenocysteine-containing dehydrogenase